MSGMKVYIAGPMRGIPYFNFPAFFEAEVGLIKQGFQVLNPAKRDEKGGFRWKRCPFGSQEELAEQGFDLRKAMREDLSMICNSAEGLVLLPGHEESLGATVELDLAVCLGLPVFPWGESCHL